MILLAPADVCRLVARVGESSRYNNQTVGGGLHYREFSVRWSPTQQSRPYDNQLQGRRNKPVPESPEEQCQQNKLVPESGLEYEPAMYYSDDDNMTDTRTTTTRSSQDRWRRSQTSTSSTFSRPGQPQQLEGGGSRRVA